MTLRTRDALSDTASIIAIVGTALAILVGAHTLAWSAPGDGPGNRESQQDRDSGALEHHDFFRGMLSDGSIGGTSMSDIQQKIHDMTCMMCDGPRDPYSKNYEQTSDMPSRTLDGSLATHAL